MKIDIEVWDKSKLYDNIYEIIDREQSDVDKVRISTYGIYAGVLHDGRFVNEWGPKYHNSVGEMFDVLNTAGVPAHIKIGKPMPIKCGLYDASKCAARIKNTRWTKRFEKMAERWSHIKFDLCESLHSKMILIGPHHCIWGSTNLSDSSISDLTTYTADKAFYNKMKKMFEAIITM